MTIPLPRVSTENLPHCDHTVCNKKGESITPEDVDFILNCLVEQGIIVATTDGKYKPRDGYERVGTWF